MRSRLGLGVVSVAAVSSLFLTACGGDNSAGGGGSGGGDQDPYVVMISGGSDAGGLTDQLVAGVLAAKAGVNVVNENGGMNGRKVELLESPDNADPAAALTALNEQIAKAKPDAYLVASGSNVSAAVAETLARNSIIFLDSANVPATNDPDKAPLSFHLIAPVTDVLKSFIPEFEKNGYKKIGILRGNSAYAKTFGDQASQVFKDEGYDVVGNVEYDAASLDMTAQIQELQADNPDVVVLNGYGAPVGYVLDGIHKLGWDIPLLGDTSVTATPLVTTEPPDGLVGTDEVANLLIQVTRSLVPSEQTDATKKAVEAMKAEGTITATLTNCQNYDAVMLLASAANHAKSTDAEDIAKAFFDPDVTGTDSGTAIYPERKYSSDNHEPSVPADTHTFVAPAPVVDGQLSDASN